MANNYSNWIMTSKFAEVEAAAAQSLNKIEWVRFVTTSQTFTLADLAGFNDLTLQTITIQQQKNVSSVKVTGSTATVTGVFTSTGNHETYYANTILLVGKYNNVEFLAGSTIATGQAMRLPADSPDEYVEFTVRSQISVTSTDTISTTVDPITSATNERVTAEVEGLQIQINETKGAISSLASSTTTGLTGKVGKTGNETIDGVKTFTSTITGSISGNAGNVLTTLTDAAASGELPSTAANTGIKALMQSARNYLKWLASKFDAHLSNDSNPHGVTASQVSAYTKSEVDALIADTKLAMNPVGTILTTLTAANPSGYIGGTWERFGKGRTLVSVDENDSDLSTSSKTGGSTNPLSEHNHTLKMIINGGTDGATVKKYGIKYSEEKTWRVGDLASVNESSTALPATETGGIAKTKGNNANHANWQPFVTVYFWRRTA